MKQYREVNIDQGDPLIPILNLVCMLIPLLLYGAVFVKFQTLDVQPPKTPAIVDLSHPLDDDALRLKVTVGREGFYISVNPRYRQAWMADEGSGPDIPKTDNGLDFDELRRKISELKGAHTTEQTIFIGAEDDIDYETIIKTMDYTRGTTERPLFPNVQLTRSTV
ncbi:MAG: biopolymer transporter ExbD [Deltaproteobacteria bacterium]|nr:biopolymer transporter ExbD [Deltaproteobacteria bacterium]